MQGLHQPHTGQVDLTNLPRFGCQAYKLIQPKPGKFEPRAAKGWFMGFQENTDKNFIIYYPQWTASQGWKWIENFNPHASFNEDIMFGDKLSPINQQKTTNYWASDNSLFTETMNYQHNPPLTPELQTPASFERESSSPTTLESDSITQDATEDSALADNINNRPKSIVQEVTSLLSSEEQLPPTDIRNVSSQSSEQGSLSELYHSEDIADSPPRIILP